MDATDRTDRTDKNLDAALAHTVSEITRTDTKAGLILTLDGLLVAALSFLGTELDGAALVAALIGAAALIGSVVLAVLVIKPRLTGGGLVDKGSFIFYADASDEAIDASLTEDLRRTRVRVLSRIALRKMRSLHYASYASIAAVVAIAAAILTR
ncbi:Pycsar system effector family protein [Streptomyces scopuliridis]|uniref:Pycsar system effector family protein n=1 Tax=Streptomyces scopuliridis TaxID=452529 RepID=UPI0035D6288B